MSQTTNRPPERKTRPAIVPDAYRLLSGWCYVEHSLLRIWAGWGRHAEDWQDKSAVCYHAWLQAQTTERMRQRMGMFPGAKADQPVAEAFETLANAVLLASSWRQATAGVAWLNRVLVQVYRSYLAAAHPVHDRPTFELLQEVLRFKDQQLSWYEDFSKRYLHTIGPEQTVRLETALASVGGLSTPMEPREPRAQACGKRTDFRLPKTPGRVKDWDKAPNVMPLLELDWSSSVEARRLFFCIGYMWEMGVAENQLAWIYYADFMPWDFIYAETRHMWDESRHGMSGMARLNEFGLDVADVGYSSYGASDPSPMTHMTALDVYEAFYNVTQVAETGYFETKRYCFEDFRLGDDDASAEMMQYDIIDETSHVEYGRIWLEEMGRRSGKIEDYRIRGQKDRVAAQSASDLRFAQYRDVMAGRLSPDQIPRLGASEYNPASVSAAATLLNPVSRSHYGRLIEMLRSRPTLKNVQTAPLRPNLPM